jgi:hypothetical protein
MEHTVELIDKVILLDNSVAMGSRRKATFNIDGVNITVTVKFSYYHKSRNGSGAYRLYCDNPLLKQHEDYDIIRRKILIILSKHPPEDNYKMNLRAIR